MESPSRGQPTPSHDQNAQIYQTRRKDTHISQPLNITQVELRVPDDLHEYRFGFVVDGCGKICGVTGGNKLDANAKLLECH